MARLRDARVLVIGLTILSYLSVGPIIFAAGLNVKYSGWIFAALPSLLSASVLWLYARYRQFPRIKSMAECLLAGPLLAIAALFFSYAAMRLNKPLADAWLSKTDQNLGLDWWAFMHMVDSHPVLAQSLGKAYETFSTQLLLIPAVLCLLGQQSRAYMMVMSFALICYTESFIAIWFPGMGTYPTYNLAADLPTYINTSLGYGSISELEAVRSKPDFVLDVNTAAGIICFPSGHAAVAALCVWAGWSMPYARYPLLGLNILMAVAAVTHGSHYFIDIPAGIGVAIIVIAAVSAAASKSVKPAPPTLQSDAYPQTHRKLAG